MQQFDHFSMTPSQLARHQSNSVNEQANTTILPAIRRTGGTGPSGIKDDGIKKTLMDIFSSAVNIKSQPAYINDKHNVVSLQKIKTHDENK